MRATIKDIEKATGLTSATISRYLNGIKVRQENAERIDRAIVDLNYKVNEVARSLRVNKTRIIGLVFSQLNDIFAANLIHFTQQSLAARGYSSMMAVSNGLPEEEREAVKFLIHRQVDGIISVPITPHSGAYDAARQYGVPAVFLDTDLTACGDSVTADNEEMGRRAAALFLDGGRPDAAILCGQEGSYSADLRLKGFLGEYERRGVPFPAERVVRCVALEDYAYRAASECFDTPGFPRAMFCTNYNITLGLLTAVNERRMEIGRDIHIVSVDNFHLSRVLHPKIFIFEQDMKRMAECAVQDLLERVEGACERELLGRLQKIPSILLEGEL